MKVPGFVFALLVFGSIALAQEPSGTGFKLVLSDHPGQLTWIADALYKENRDFWSFLLSLQSDK